MVSASDADDLIPNLKPDKEARIRLKIRARRLREDPDYRAQQRLRQQIAQSNGVATRSGRNAKISLPKFSWDK